jgi:large subunit ribosomal protein L6
MSRIGKALVQIPSGVTVDVTKGNFVTVKGTRGTLTQSVDPDLMIKIEDGNITVDRPTEQKRHKAAHGLYRSLINNMVNGVSTGFKKEMELIGVGYRVSNTGNMLELTIGYSHPIYFEIPKELTLTTKMDKGEAPTIILEGADNQLLGQVCAKIRAYRKPEPYKGKGIKFKGEVIRRKAGKTSGKKK